MPASVRTHAPVWKKRREVKIGRPTQSRLPWAMAMSSDESDISETSNSWKCSCRQKISDGCAVVQVSSMPSGEIDPSRTGRDRSLAPMIKLSCSFPIRAKPSS
jgi:hypothetical protein